MKKIIYFIIILILLISSYILYFNENINKLSIIQSNITGKKIIKGEGVENIKLFKNFIPSEQCKHNKIKDCINKSKVLNGYSNTGFNEYRINGEDIYKILLKDNFKIGKKNRLGVFKNNELIVTLDTFIGSDLGINNIGTIDNEFTFEFNSLGKDNKCSNIQNNALEGCNLTEIYYKGILLSEKYLLDSAYNIFKYDGKIGFIGVLNNEDIIIFIN